jgi:DNA-binding CsgD family transcriptional regulator
MKKAFRKKARPTPEAFETLLDDIYAAGEDERIWPTVLAALASQFSAPAGALHAGARDAQDFSFAAVHGVIPAAQVAYEEYFHSINPLNAALSRLPAGAVAPDHHMVAPQVLARTEFYNDYAKSFDLGGSIYLVIARDDRNEACLSIVRSLKSDPFTQEHVSFIQRLGPHIRRAIGLNRHLAGMQDRHSSLEIALDSMETAVLVLDGTGAISNCNTAGAKLLEKGDGLKVSRGRLCADDQSAQDRLAGYLRKALTPKGARGGSVLVPRRCSTRPLLIKIMPIAQRNEFWLNSTHPCAILFVADPDAAAGAAVDEVVAAYGLTPSEGRLLSALVEGRSLKEAAETLKIARATSRNRLARIMTKTDTHRQGELIQLILRSSVPIR